MSPNADYVRVIEEHQAKYFIYGIEVPEQVFNAYQLGVRDGWRNAMSQEHPPEVPPNDRSGPADGG